MAKPAKRQFFVESTLRWAPVAELVSTPHLEWVRDDAGVEEVGLAQRTEDGPEEVVGYNHRAEGQLFLFKQRKCKVIKALSNGQLGVSFNTKDDYWHRNCVSAVDLEDIPKPKSKRKKPPPPKKEEAPAEAAAEAAADDGNGESPAGS